VLTLAGLGAAAIGGAFLGTVGLLAALLPLLLVVYSTAMADLGAARGDGPALAYANAELRAANERLALQLVALTGDGLRGVDAASYDGLRPTARLLRAFLEAQADAIRDPEDNPDPSLVA